MEQTSYQQLGVPPPGTPPKNWLVESILATIFCCLPFGIAGIVFASQVNSKWATGDAAGALESSKQAGKWTKIAFWIGIAQIVIWVIWLFLLGGLAIWQGSRASYN